MAALDTVVRGELPLEIHAIVIAQQQLRVAKRRCTAFRPASPETPDEWEDFVFDCLLVAGNNHTHGHQATCTCGKRARLVAECVRHGHMATRAQAAASCVC